jgi:peroxiredoxin
MEDSENLETPQPTYLSPEPPNRKRLLIPVVAILAITIASLMAVKASFQKPKTRLTEPVELSEGSQLPDLELVRMDGSKVSLSDLKHKVMLINFWATWCEACLEEMPSLVQLRSQYSPKGFEVLGINVDDNPVPAATQMAARLSINFPLFTDKNGDLSAVFDLNAIPLTVIINGDRKILMVESGGRDWNSEEIQQLLGKWLSET